MKPFFPFNNSPHFWKISNTRDVLSAAKFPGVTIYFKSILFEIFDIYKVT